MRARLLGAVIAAMAATGATAAAQTPGGSVRFLAAFDVSSLDPGVSYYSFDNVILGAVQRTLYAYRPSGGVVPDLADGPPQISPDGRTVTVHLRAGVRYAPPVNREVTSADVAYAFARAFSDRVSNGYSDLYFADIVGAPRTPTDGVRPLAGVSTPDSHTLVFRLRRPTGPSLAAALVMPITAPVPAEYAAAFDRHNPSDYARSPASTGPYMISRYSPGSRIELVRNPNWDRATDFRPALLDAITIEEGNDDLAAAARRTLGGSGLLCCDFLLPPAVLSSARRRAPNQVARVPGGTTRWISLNMSRAPFDERDVRRGVVAGLDRVALARAYGGGRVASQFLPPGIGGFAESGGARGFDFAFMRHPRGSRSLAARYFRRARFSPGSVSMIVQDSPRGHAIARVAERGFRRLGFRPRVRFSDLALLRCGKRVHVCLGDGWVRDFDDAASVLPAAFGGDSPANLSRLDSARVDALLSRAEELPAGPARSRAWAAANRAIVSEAPAVPYLWDDVYVLRSRDVRGALNPFSFNWDLSFSSLG